MNRFLKPIIAVIASIYFLIAGAMMVVACPIVNWLAQLGFFSGLRAWIVSLRPYPTLALFALPLILLEPAKHCGAYLIAKGHLMVGLLLLAVAEILKLVLLERLFAVSKDKLMSIPAFAWIYRHFRQIIDRLKPTSASVRSAGRPAHDGWSYVIPLSLYAVIDAVEKLAGGALGILIARMLLVYRADKTR
jgi:hypothetical protein